MNRWLWCALCIFLPVAECAWGQIPLLPDAVSEAIPLPQQPAAAPCAASCCARCRSETCCCPGREVCCPTIEEVTEKRSCWKVSCERVCIPAVRCPWEPGGSGLTLFSCLRRPRDTVCCETCGCPTGGCSCIQPICGQVRSIRVLESEEYEVKTCQCKWEIRRLPPCGAAIEERLPANSQISERALMPYSVPMPPGGAP